ncbi:MAG: hypothetical protein EOO62_29270, partial [Hymenobacter sp.]
MKEQVIQFLDRFPDELTTLLVIGGSLLAGWLGKVLFFLALRTYERRVGSMLARSVRRRMGRALTFFVPVLLLSVLLPLAPLPAKLFEVLRRTVEISLIVTFAWVLMRGVEVIEDLVLDHYRLTPDTNLEARKLLTQLQFVEKMVVSLIFFVAVALVLMSFA